MAQRLTDHPDRFSLAAEVHARPSVELETPMRASYVAVLIAPEDRSYELAHLVALCERFAVSPPVGVATHFNAKIGQVLLKWERHSEFSGYTFFIPNLSPVPFSEPAAGFLPDGWLEGIPGLRVVAAHAKLISGGGPLSDAELETAFAGNTPVGADIGEGPRIPDGAHSALTAQHEGPRRCEPCDPCSCVIRETGGPAEPFARLARFASIPAPPGARMRPLAFRSIQ